MVVDILHTEDIPEDQTVLPSPEDLSGFVLVKVSLTLIDRNFYHFSQLSSHNVLFVFQCRWLDARTKYCKLFGIVLYIFLFT